MGSNKKFFRVLQGKILYQEDYSKVRNSLFKQTSPSPSKINPNSQTPDTIAKLSTKIKILEHLKLHYREQCAPRSLLQLIYMQA